MRSRFGRVFLLVLLAWSMPLRRAAAADGGNAASSEQSKESPSKEFPAGEPPAKEPPVNEPPERESGSGKEGSRREGGSRETAGKERPAEVAAPSPAHEYRFDLHKLRRYESGTGWGYYQLMDGGRFLRGTYKPGTDTVSLGLETPEPLRSKAKRLRWRWRVLALPENGNECKRGVQDSAAVIYVTFKGGLKWRILKYVWSTVGPRGATCDKKRYLFGSQDTVIQESGGPTEIWREEEIDLRAAYIEHFADGDASASVPDFVGVGILTDGDSTSSPAIADFADFTVVD
jgi:hypothetical protein